jgi:hypothetical protein
MLARALLSCCLRFTMISLAQRQRSTGELVFSVLKTLLCGYRLWGTKSGLHVAELAESLHASEASLIGAVGYLAAEGLVTLDECAGTIRLTEKAACNLLVEPGTDRLPVG